MSADWIKNIENSLCDTKNIVRRIIQALMKQERLTVTFINPHVFWVINNRDSIENYPLEKFEVIGVDGIGMVFFLRKMLGKNIERSSFDSTSVATALFSDGGFCKKARLFLLGSTTAANTKAADILKNKFPILNIVGRCDGYYQNFESVVKQIQDSEANFVLVGMGAPLQEVVALKLSKRINNIVVCTCGGYIEQLSEGYNYYPGWIDYLNLRFIYRIFREPKRIGRRVWAEYRPFLKEYLRLYFQ